MPRRDTRHARSAFTITEILVSVAVVTALISIAAPALRGARDAARTSIATSIQRQLQTGAAAYTEGARDWIPGINSTGLLMARCVRERPELLDAHTHMPVQDVDWMTPALADEDLPYERAARFATILDRYADPALKRPAELYTEAYEQWQSGTDNMAAWLEADSRRELIANSYLMPIAFQLFGGFGTRDSYGPGQNFHASHGQRDQRFVPQTYDAVIHDSFQPKLTEIGAPATKIANATGLRYYNGGGLITINAAYAPARMGAFATWGAIYTGSESYGQQQPPTSGQHRNETNGEQSEYVYRHNGKLIAAFFDGHVELLGVAESQNPILWYPRGSTMGRRGTSISETAFGFVEEGEMIP